MRKTSLMVLTHLILNDMMKVKGHVAALALRLRDDEPRIAALAALFFHELANKACKARAHYTLYPISAAPAPPACRRPWRHAGYWRPRCHTPWPDAGHDSRFQRSQVHASASARLGRRCVQGEEKKPPGGAAQGTNPIYNLLPDMLSALAAEPGLPPAGFQAIMRTLLGYIGRDRQADALVDKLLARFEGAAAPPQWRNLAFCLAQARAGRRRRARGAAGLAPWGTQLGQAAGQRAGSGRGGTALLLI